MDLRDVSDDQLYRGVSATLRTVLSRIRGDDLPRPTPCVGWDLRMLAGHLVGQNRGFATAIAAGDAMVSEYAPTPVKDEDDLLRLWDDSVERLLAAWSGVDPEKQVRLIELSADSSFSATAAMRVQVLDTVVHTWDVAASLGLSHRPSPVVIEMVVAMARKIPDGPTRSRPGAAFAPPVGTDSADPWIEILTRLGRKA